MGAISEKTVDRLIQYRRNLLTVEKQHMGQIFSHQIAKMSGVTAAQVRRDLMAIGYSGSPVRGYHFNALLESLGDFIDAKTKQGVALVGVGQVGRALLHYFQGRRPKLSIEALFDVDESKVNRVFHGCHSYPLARLPEIVKEKNIRVGIITVPAEVAQEVTNVMVQADIRGILNYAPVKLNVPPNVFVENRDMTLAVEKIAYLARQSLK